MANSLLDGTEQMMTMDGSTVQTRTFAEIKELVLEGGVGAPGGGSGLVTRLDEQPGVVSGGLADNAARAANLAALQAAVDAAPYDIELGPGSYEIFGPPLVLYGSRRLIRFHPDANVVQFDVTQSAIKLGGSNDERTTFDGISCSYGQDQGAETASLLWIDGSWNRSIFRNIQVRAGFGAESLVHVPYASVWIGGGMFFSNICENWNLVGARQHFIRFLPDNSTGNVWENIYCNNRNPSGNIPTEMVGPAIHLGQSGSLYESAWKQLNIEWAKTNIFIRADNCKNYVMESLHLEGCFATGSWPVYVRVGGRLHLTGLNLLNCQAKAAEGALNGVTAVYVDGWSEAQVRGLRWENGAWTDIDVPEVYLLSTKADTLDDNCRIVLEDVSIEKIPFIHWYGRDAADSALFPANMGRMEATPWSGLRTENSVYYVDQAAATVYGWDWRPVIQCEPDAAAAQTITLSDRMGRAGYMFAGAKRPQGDLCTVYRPSWGSAGVTVTVNNHDGVALATLAAGERGPLRFWFNGTDWLVA